MSSATARPRRAKAESDRNQTDGSKKPSLDERWSNLIDEGRMILPGIQTLFGFQLIVVFNDTFRDRLSATEQWLHLIAMGLVGIAVALAIGPAALHRQAPPESVSRRLADVSSTLLAWSLLPLALGSTLDFYLVASLIVGTWLWAAAFALLLGVTVAGLWFALPRLLAARDGR